MPVEILMPALSPTMTEGTLAKWTKKEGDKIKPGDVIAEIETDKATMEVEAVDEGVLGRIIVPGGSEGVAINKLIAVLLQDGEDKSEIDKFIASVSGSSPVIMQKVEPAAQKTEAVKPVSTSDSDRVKASPLAKRVAEQIGVDLRAISGSGPHGRIIKADVEDAASSAKGSAAVKAPASFGVGRNAAEYTDIPLNGMRKTIAKRLLESKQNIPHFYLSVDIELDEALKARKKLNDIAEKSAGKGKAPAYKLTVNDFVIKAVAMALRDVPAANASWADSVIRQYNNVDVSVAVALDGGLITPVLRNADQKSLSDISNEMKSLAARARDNKLKPEEFQGGGFSISNLGMFGVKNFQAIINPPQSCILAIGAGEERVVVKGGQMVVRNVMSVTLSSDHRVVDGAVGAEFLSAFRRFMEDPVMMLV